MVLSESHGRALSRRLTEKEKTRSFSLSPHCSLFHTSETCLKSSCGLGEPSRFHQSTSEDCLLCVGKQQMESYAVTGGDGNPSAYCRFQEWRRMYSLHSIDTRHSRRVECGTKVLRDPKSLKTPMKERRKNLRLSRAPRRSASRI